LTNDDEVNCDRMQFATTVVMSLW